MTCSILLNGGCVRFQWRNAISSESHVSHCDFGHICAPRGRSVHGRYFYLGEEILAPLPMAAIKLVSGTGRNCDKLGVELGVS